jgi:predicted metal-dependent hydrolase
VKDERLLAEVRAFCAQEGMHGREHTSYNDMLRKSGYPVDALEGRVKRLLGAVSKRTPKRFQLAATCALEHFTATMAHALLGDPRVLEHAHPTMAALWQWHAAEENEHRAVAYDVFLAAGGRYRERAIAMLIASAIFWPLVLDQQIRLARANGTLYSAREWGELAHFLFVDPGVMRTIAHFFFAYFRPGFHPNENDASALIAEWKRKFEEEAVYRSAAVA